MPAHGLCPTCLVVVLHSVTGCGSGTMAVDTDRSIGFDIQDVTPAQARHFESWTRDALGRVDRWWGSPFGGRIFVSVGDRFRISRALVPAWRGERGRVEVPAGRVRDGMAAMVHELTHVTAPNANRFLAEGLSTHAQEHLGGVSAFPNFGRDLHRAAKALLSKWSPADVAALERIPTPDRLLLDGRLDEQQTYILAGSFVRWLIETNGEVRFRRLYAMTPLAPRERIPGDPDRWVAAYRAGFDRLVATWRAFLEELAAKE